MPKKVVYHVYNSSGTFIRILPDVVTAPNYSWAINSGPQNMKVSYPRKWHSAGELGESNSPLDLVLGNSIKAQISDDQLFVTTIYTGAIEEYTIQEPVDASGIDVLLVPKTSRFADRFISTPISFVNTDPMNMAKYFVDNGYLPGIAWDASNSSLIGQLFTETFNNQTVGQAFESIRRFGGSNCFWRLNPNDTLTFSTFNLSAAATHKLNGKNVSVIKYIRSKVGVKTHVIVFGAEVKDEDGLVIDRIKGEAFASEYSASDPRDLIITNSRLTDGATANRIATSELEFSRPESIESEVIIPDTSIDALSGYDIETLKPGQTLQFVNPNYSYAPNLWGSIVYGTDAWGNEYPGLVQLPLVIANVSYGFYTARVKLSNRPTPVVEELVNLSDRLLLEGSK